MIAETALVVDPELISSLFGVTGSRSGAGDSLLWPRSMAFYKLSITMTVTTDTTN